MTDAKPQRGATTRLTPVADLTAGDLACWADLAGRSAEPNPFFEPEFVVAAARHLGASPALLLVEDAGDWLACMPVVRSRLGGVIRNVRTWAHLYSFLGTPLLDAEDPVAAARTLLRRDRGRAQLLLLEAVADDGPAGMAITEASSELGLTAIFESSYERAFLKRRAQDDYLSGMKSHRRRELNRLGRRMGTELGGEVSVTLEQAGDETLSAFLTLEQSGWKGQRSTAMASNPEHESFFRGVCLEMAGRDRLELLTLRVGDRRVAMKCNFLAGDGGFCFKIAFDDSLSQFSPGVQLERENIRLFHESARSDWQDSCADPANAMINRLWPDRRRIVTKVLGPSGMRAHAGRRAANVVQSLREDRRRRAGLKSHPRPADSDER